MLLCYTGASRFSGNTIGRVMHAYERGDARVSAALDGLRRVADDMTAALRAADFARMGALLSENWRLQQQLDPGMSTPEMAGLEKAMLEAGALGGKAAGLRRRRLHVLSRARRSGAGQRSGAAAGHAASAGAVVADGGAAMLSGELVTSRRDLVAESSDLSALAGRLAARADRFLGRPLTPPALKALLTADGGICPDDGSSLEFDPWRPGAHRCPRCGRELAGPRHNGAWARWQHLWLAERAAELAAVGVLADRQDAAEASARILASLRRALRSSCPTATTCWDPAGCSSPPISSPSGSTTTSPPPACCARAGCSTRRSRKRSMPSPTRPRT